MKMYPDWVMKHKQKGTNISCINGRYYLYSVCSVWNKEKGRAQKITKEYLGRITEDGLITPRKKILKAQTPVTVKEYGAFFVLNTIGSDILCNLRNAFPIHGELIFSIAALRVIEQCPFKRVEFFYNNSCLSETYKGLKLSGGDLSKFLEDFGSNREKIIDFMKHFISGNEHIMFDGSGGQEKSFDFYKKLLDQDKSFIQDEKSLETLAFINHISLTLNYKIYNLLQEKELLPEFSVADFLSHLKYIFKIKINNAWCLSEITKEPKLLLKALNLHINNNSENMGDK